MTTAIPPRQPAKRAKGRAHTLHADPYETVVGWQLFADEYDQAVERMARAIYKNERRFEPKRMTWETTWKAVRIAYLKDARAALKSIGIAAPRKERKTL